MNSGNGGKENATKDEAGQFKLIINLFSIIALSLSFLSLILSLKSIYLLTFILVDLKFKLNKYDFIY